MKRPHHARTAAAISLATAVGLSAGGSGHGEPGLRPDYDPTYFAAFLIDPDGNRVEAVYHRAGVHVVY